MGVFSSGFRFKVRLKHVGLVNESECYIQIIAEIYVEGYFNFLGNARVIKVHYHKACRYEKVDESTL